MRCTALMRCDGLMRGCWGDEWGCGGRRKGGGGGGGTLASHLAAPADPPPAEFTTLTCIPGMIRYRGAKIQLLDLPGIIEGAKDGKGRGRQVISTARTCNLIIIVLDCLKPITHKKLIEKELEGEWGDIAWGFLHLAVVW